MASRTTRERVFLLVMLGAALALTAWVLAPFLAVLFMATVLAVALHPVQARLAARFGDRPRLAAVVITLGAILVIVVPLLLLAAILTNEVVALVGEIRDMWAAEGVEGLLSRIPEPIREQARRGLETLTEGRDDFIARQAGRVATLVTRMIATSAEVLFQALMMVIALFFLLVDGARLGRWIADFLPAEREELESLILEMRKVTWSVVMAGILTGLLQSFVAWGGYAIVGLENVLLLAFATFLFAFVPVVGAGFLVSAVGVVVFVGGDHWQGVFLVGWGTLVVGLVDNLVRPFIMGADMHIHSGVILFALLGGLAAFGPIGLVVGPLAVALLLAVLRLAVRRGELGRLDAADT